MRVLHVITSLRIGGAERLMVDLLPILRKKGDNVELLLFDGVRTSFFEELENLGIKINIISESDNVYNPLYIMKLHPFLRKFDIVHTHNTSPQFFAAICSVFCKVKLITTEHNTTNRRRNWPFFKFVDKWVYRRYSKIICISDQAEINLRKYIKDDTLDIVTISNGIDFVKFADASPDEVLIEEKGENKALVMVAGFRPQKDQDTIIKALNFLPENVILWLVGDGERANELKALVCDCKLENRVFFLGVRTDVPNILKSADIIIMSSHYEGLSLSNLEGMSVGKPFIASDVDGIREITKDAGLLFLHGSAKELAVLVNKLLSDSFYYDKVALDCYSRAQNYSIEKMAILYSNVYNQI